MLELRNITKVYPAPSGDGGVTALKGVTLSFRKSEFVSILGPSGCGKTTLLNIIGGLDRYSAGDLLINSKSTREFFDRDWDNYRNHSVGFVFQSYNLIPHQTALANVELALTLSGVSKSERRKRAVAVMERVGLGDQLSKLPAQMSGGQAQRVAIARALVNDPDIILADEPTGALDTETSVQIMEILREVARDRLVVMVTHNPELAGSYSDRIINLLDGRVVSDSRPFAGGEEAKPEKNDAGKKPSMSFLTALSLSFNNLLTKKGRTILTAFAGSIGIIGIALVASITAGVNSYISRVQEDTLSSYPITVRSEEVDMSSLLGAFAGAKRASDESSHELDAVYSDSSMYELVNSLNSLETKTNDLKAFKRYLDSTGALDSVASSVSWTYDLSLSFYTRDPSGKVFRSDVNDLFEALYGGGTFMPGSGFMSGVSLSGYDIWEQMLPGSDGSLVDPLLKEQYDLVAGDWPESAGDVVLVVDEKNELNDFVIWSLGLRDVEQMRADMLASSSGKQIEVASDRWDYDFILSRDFRVIPAAERFVYDEKTGTCTDLLSGEAGAELLYGSPNAVTLRICGIIRKNPDAVAAMLNGSLCYTAALTDAVLELTRENPVILRQLAEPERDVLTGLPFEGAAAPADDEGKIAEAEKFILAADEKQRAEIFRGLSLRIPDGLIEEQTEQFLSSKTRDELEKMMTDGLSAQMGSQDTSAIVHAISSMSDGDFYTLLRRMIAEKLKTDHAESVSESLASLDDAALSEMLSQKELEDDELLFVFDNYVPSAASSSTYEENLKLLGWADRDSPASVSIYCRTFADKEKAEQVIKDYNASADEAGRITYTDYVAQMMSGVSTIINAISYVLMAFVSVSLVVSSIMIGIITYISVLERTKEIGILRAIGASKNDVSGVFNAETFIVGLCAGVIGILVTLLLIVPINLIIHALSGVSSLSAVLPPDTALLLIALSLGLTMLAGFLPSRLASKKDPVEALRSE